MDSKIVENEWQYGLLDCFKAPGNIFLKVFNLINHKNNTHWKDFCLFPCTVLCVFDNTFHCSFGGCNLCISFCCPCIATCSSRIKRRREWKIEGNILEDIFLGLFCYPLVTCQLVGEYERREGLGIWGLDCVDGDIPDVDDEEEESSDNDKKPRVDDGISIISS